MDFLICAVAAITILLNFAVPIAAKYCTYDIDGEFKYYVCPRNEYCCNFGCCLSPAFQFYQLWYYWLMVIFMFLLCSGGGWWYRYWLQGRYGPELGTPMPPPSSRLNSHHLSHRPARVSYHPSREAVVLHHIWKPRGLGAAFPHASPPPSYASAQRATSVSLPLEASQTSSGLSNVVSSAGPKLSPYYQLYGPPPPYEVVISSQQDSSQNFSSTGDSTLQQHTSSQISDNCPVVSVSCSDDNPSSDRIGSISPPISNDSAPNRAPVSSSSSSSQETSNMNQNV